MGISDNSAPLISASGRSHELGPRKVLRLLAARTGSSNHHEASKAQFKVPVGDGPYVRAKQTQLVEKDPERAIALFWAAINARDRVDSALKDMAVVMKQQNRGDEAIQAILSFRHLCSPFAQESLDNVLLDLYKKCGRYDDQIDLLKHKLGLIHKGMVFNGKRTKTARSQGRKFQLSIQQEATRLLGNLGWAYMQLCNYVAAEAVYRKALSMEVDNNKLCNLGVCLLKQGKEEEARAVLERVTPLSPDGRLNSESHVKSYQRSRALLNELSPNNVPSLSSNHDQQALITPQEFDLWTHWTPWEAPISSQNPPNPAAVKDIINNINPASVISTNRPALLSSKNIINASNQLIEPLLTPPTCDIALTLGGGTATNCMSTGSFKREIGPPSSTVQQSNRAKKNSRGHEKSGFGLLNHNSVAENFAMETDVIYCISPNRDWVSCPLSQEPLAKTRLFDKTISRAKVRIDNGCGHGEDFSNSTNEVMKTDVSSLRHEYQAQGASSITSVLDFSCVDKVIESVVLVADAPSASDTVLNMSIQADAAGNVDCISNNSANTSAMEKMRHPSDYNNGDRMARQDLGTWPDAPVFLQSLTEVHPAQHRLRVFQDMTHDAGLNV